MTRKDIPNLISILRIFLVVPVVWLLLEHKYADALILFAIAGISDGLDGYLAKRNNWGTRLGSVLDPIADKLLLVSSYIVLGWLGLVPGWLVFAVLGRDAVIISGALGFHFLIGKYDMSPSMISKTNTAAQIVLVVIVIYAQTMHIIPSLFVEGLIYFVLITTVLSGIDYVMVWGRRAWHEHYRHKNQIQ